MKNRLFFLLCMACIGSAHAQSGVVGLSYEQVDTVLENKAGYEKKKQERIAFLQKQLKEPFLEKERQYELTHRLYEEFQLYNYDQAHGYAQEMSRLANELADEDKRFQSTLSMAYSCLNAGLFKESDEIARAIDAERLKPHYQVALYSFFAKLHLDMSHSIGVEPFRTQYRGQSIQYSRRIIDLLGEDHPSGLPYKVNIYRCQQNFRKAIETVKEHIASRKLSQRELSLDIGGLGQFYLFEGDTARAIPCLCYAAIEDIRSVVKETPALCMLAEIAYNKGDLKRAYAYASEAFSDANFYNARHRKIEVGNVLPIIEKARFSIIREERRRLTVFSLLTSVLLVCFLIALCVILKQMKQLKQARKINKKQNEELLAVNEKLKEADRLKNGYIGYFFQVNSSYIEKLEDLQKLLNRKIRSKQYDDLGKLLKITEIKKEREDMFDTFDQIFLKMFPNFVEQFNALLKDEYRIAPKSNKALTPEMRIFALIRLEITDNEQIARFLHYSLNTIHTYKTKMKNRSVVPNEAFEQKIRQIESVRYEI